MLAKSCCVCIQQRFLFLSCILCVFSNINGSNSVNTTVKDITTATENKPVPLDCPASDGDYTWEYVPSNPSLSKDLFSATNTYLANVTSSSATGYYRCLLDGSPMHRFHAVNFSQPSVYHGTESIYEGKSLVLTDGDVNQTVECVSYSYPTPQFFWSVTFPEGETIDISNTISNIFSVVTNNTKSILTLSKIGYNERATYNCTIINMYTSAYATFLLRVHGRFAALWPFLGIVCEILTVAIIILVVRRESPSGGKSGSGGRGHGSTSSGSSREDDDLKVRFRKAGPSRQY